MANRVMQIFAFFLGFMFQSIQVTFIVLGLGVGVIFVVSLFLLVCTITEIVEGCCSCMVDIQPKASCMVIVEGEKRKATVE